MKLKAAEQKLQQKAIALVTNASNVAAILNTQPTVGDIALEALEDDCFEMIALMREYRRKKNPMEVKGQRG